MTTALERAAALRREGQPGEALALFQQALREDPLNPEIWRGAAKSAADAGQDATAARLLEGYLRLTPDDAGARHALGIARFNLRDYGGAEAAFRRVLELRPMSIGALVVLGTIMYLVGRRDEGYRLHGRALEIETSDPRQLTARALLRVSRGDWLRGWEEYEARWDPVVGYRMPRPMGRDLTPRRWDGTPDPRRTVCVHPEAGFGDTFLFARYLPLVAERVGRVLFASSPPVEPVLSPIRGLAGFADQRTQADPELLHVSVFSLPWVFRSTPETVPRTPYLRAPAGGPALPARARGTRLRAGLVWAGKATQHLDYDRSVPSLDVLSPVLAVPGIEWVSLQVGGRAAEGDAYGMRPCPTLADFGDTAHVLSQLDLVVTVDSAVANLAGGMGIPTWVMVQTHPEIRWPVDRDDSPWFPTARVFRREHSDDWAGMAERLARALTVHVDGLPPR